MYYINPRMEKLYDPMVWVDAAVQVFYSIGVGFGVHLSYASFNKFHNNCYRDCLITTAVNSLTSFYSGFVIFTYLGYMALTMDKDIENVASEGYGLVFQVIKRKLLVCFVHHTCLLPGLPRSHFHVTICQVLVHTVLHNVVDTGNRFGGTVNLSCELIQSECLNCFPDGRFGSGHHWTAGRVQHQVHPSRDVRSGHHLHFVRWITDQLHAGMPQCSSLRMLST